jgi:hypothetical protein
MAPRNHLSDFEEKALAVALLDLGLFIMAF